jgi:hypothetical protein
MEFHTCGIDSWASPRGPTKKEREREEKIIEKRSKRETKRGEKEKERKRGSRAENPQIADGTGSRDQGGRVDNPGGEGHSRDTQENADPLSLVAGDSVTRRY